MDVNEQLCIVSRLLHFRINMNVPCSWTEFIGQHVRDLSAVKEVLIGAFGEVIHGRFQLPHDAPPVEPHGLCARIMMHPSESRYTLRVYSLRNDSVGLSSHYRWRQSDVRCLLTWWMRNGEAVMQAILTALEGYLKCGENGILSIIGDYACATSPDVCMKAWQSCS